VNIKAYTAVIIYLKYKNDGFTICSRYFYHAGSCAIVIKASFIKHAIARAQKIACEKVDLYQASKKAGAFETTIQQRNKKQAERFESVYE
jgi:hypothetical protein